VISRHFLDAETFFLRAEELPVFAEAVANFSEFESDVAFTIVCRHFHRLAEQGCAFAPEVLFRMLTAWHHCQNGDVWRGLGAAVGRDQELLAAVSPDLALVAIEAIKQIEGENADGDPTVVHDEITACYGVLTMVMAGPNPQTDLFIEFFEFGLVASIEADWGSEGELICAAHTAFAAGVRLVGILPAAMQYLDWHMGDPGQRPEILEMCPFVASVILRLRPTDIDEMVMLALRQFWEWFTNPIDPDIVDSVLPWAFAEVAAWRIQARLVTPEEIGRAYEVALQFAQGPLYQVLGAFDVAASLAIMNALPEADVPAWAERSRYLAEEGALFREQDTLLHRWFSAVVGAGELELKILGAHPHLPELGTYLEAWLPWSRVLKHRADAQ
jgi:hypothetical protein